MGKRLITDRDVLEGRVSSPLRLDDDTLITPSARDRCCRLGIVVVEPGGGTGCSPRRSGGPGCGSASCAGDCSRCAQGGAGSGAAASAGAANTAGLGALPDGLYLVRVAAGRVASILPAGGPGAMPVARDLGERRDAGGRP